MNAALPRVIIAIPTSGQVGRDQFSGVFGYFGRSIAWDVRLLTSHHDLTAEIIRSEIKRNLAGVITSDPYSPEVAAALTAAKVPVIVLHDSYHGKPETGKNFYFTLMDNVAIGRKAAEYFLSLGRFSTYAFICDAEGNRWSKEREEGYRCALKAERKSVKSFFSHPASPPRDLPTAALERFLRSLELPAAVFAANDLYAIQTMNVCHRLGLKIPEQVSVLGVDNDAVASSRAPAALSSIEPDFVAEGRAAARALDLLLAVQRAKPRIPRIQRFGVRNLVERTSTTPLSPAAKLVEDALVYIDEHGLEPIDPAGIATHLRVSRTLLDLRFRQIRNTTVSDAIRERRLNEVKNLLTTTDLSIDHISAQCGFKNANHLRNLFRRTFDVSMREYRAASCRPSTLRCAPER